MAGEERKPSIIISTNKPPVFDSLSEQEKIQYLNQLSKESFEKTIETVHRFVARPPVDRESEK